MPPSVAHATLFVHPHVPFGGFVVVFRPLAEYFVLHVGYSVLLSTEKRAGVHTRLAEGSCERRLVPPSTVLLEPEVHVKSVEKNGKVQMACRFCDEGASRSGRQWFRRTLEGTFTRLTPDAHDDPVLNRRTMAADHTLTLANVTEADVGFYVCHDNEEPPAQYRMEYLLDVAIPRKTDPKTGNEEQYQKYLEELQAAYEKLDLEGPLQRYTVATNWDDWGLCDRCGEVGLRKRYGRCQLRTTVDALFTAPGTQARWPPFHSRRLV
ncbi:uncharacterized protein LOC144175320 [Haemaphysalis longicornis]